MPPALMPMGMSLPTLHKGSSCTHVPSATRRTKLNMDAALSSLHTGTPTHNTLYYPHNDERAASMLSLVRRVALGTWVHDEPLCNVGRLIPIGMRAGGIERLYVYMVISDVLLTIFISLEYQD
eukprot:gene24616-23_t